MLRKLLILVAIWAPLCFAQTYQIDWYVIGSGGGHIQSANYQIDGTIGQPIIGHAASANYQIDAGFWAGAASLAPPCDYLIGDFNGDGSRIGGDVTYGVRYFKGIGTAPPDSCSHDSIHTTRGNWLYVSVDVNGDCNHSGADITRLVAYFKGFVSLSYCRFFPPPPAKLANPVDMAPIMINNSILQPAQSLHPTQIEPGITTNPEKDIQQQPSPIEENTNSSIKKPMR